MIFFLFLMCIKSLNCQTVGSILKSYNGYNTLEVGNLNILITAPHMGSMTPANIMDRKNVSADGITPVELDNDMNSKNIAKTIRDELMRLFKLNKNIDARPYFLYTNLKRYFFFHFYSSKILNIKFIPT